MHYGIDFNVGAGDFDLGLALLNLADGRVIDSGHTKNGGNYIVIRHGNGYITRYFHMNKKPTLLAGMSVKEGQQIGEIGNTDGYPTHGHLEIAKLEDNNVTDDEALDAFLSYAFHINPRDVIGQGKQGNGGDLQILSKDPTIKEAEQKVQDAILGYKTVLKYEDMKLQTSLNYLSIGKSNLASSSMSSSVVQDALLESILNVLYQELMLEELTTDEKIIE